MAKRIIFAVAGSGKTYHICHNIDSNKKNLLLAFTNENIKNLKREIIDAFGFLPELTNIMTFDSFIYRYLLCPYEDTVRQYFHREDFNSRGITMIEPPQRWLYSGFANKNYIKKDKLEHYVYCKQWYYCNTLSELIMTVKKGRKSLIEKAGRGVNMFYDQVMIDEFQDFRKSDYDLIMSLSNYVENMLLVGDFYQHSVSATNNSGKPFKSRKGDVDFKEFKQSLSKSKFEFDEDSLKKSRRCCIKICDYVREKLKIDIYSCSDKTGNVIWVDQNVEQVLEDDSIVKLVYNEANKYSFNAMNWSYSKGDTFGDVCVILTDTLSTLNSENFDPKKISVITRNKLYVAMTRPCKNLYLLPMSIFHPLKEKYIKQLNKED